MTVVNNSYYYIIVATVYGVFMMYKALGSVLCIHNLMYL